MNVYDMVWFEFPNIQDGQITKTKRKYIFMNTDVYSCVDRPFHHPLMCTEAQCDIKYAYVNRNINKGQKSCTPKILPG